MGPKLMSSRPNPWKPEPLMPSFPTIGPKVELEPLTLAKPLQKPARPLMSPTSNIYTIWTFPSKTRLKPFVKRCTEPMEWIIHPLPKNKLNNMNPVDLEVCPFVWPRLNTPSPVMPRPKVFPLVSEWQFERFVVV